MNETSSALESLRSNVGQTFRFLLSEVNRNPVVTVLFELLSPRRGARAMTAFFHRAVCLNQGWIIEYTFLSSRRHRDLKHAVSESDAGVGKTEDALKKLDDYAGRKFFEATAKNFELLNEYFKMKNEDTPRICVKGNLLRNHRSLVVSVFRREKVDYNTKYEISSNSGFEHCFKTGQYFLENDLPSAVNLGRYKNPRINYKHVREVQDLGLIGRRRALCENWSYIWKDGFLDRGDHYKSTLIVPMTIVNADLSEEFLEKFGDGTADRLIFGFLCFDHHEVGYFDQEDINAAYFFADFISLFAYNLLNFTTYSETHKNASQATGHSPQAPIFDIEKSWDAQSLKRESTVARTAGKKSRNNVLVYFARNDAD